MVSTVVAPNTYSMAFFILGSFNIKNLVVLPVNECSFSYLKTYHHPELVLQIYMLLVLPEF